MIIQYLGHASFLITTKSETRIVTDPFNPGCYPGTLLYRSFDGPADIVTASHEHSDHSYFEGVKGAPILIKGNGKFTACGVDFTGVETYHDKSHGSERGRNTVFIISADELRVAHLGDLGHVLTADQAAEIGAVDIALIPVGGHYTIDAADAGKVAAQIEAKIIIPMHYKTEKCKFPLASVDEFIKDKTNVVYQESSVLEVTRKTLPKEPTIIVLDYSL